MEIRQLQIFITVDTAGSLSAAALELSVTQPLITRQVRALEEELGVELFYRNGRGVVLTDAGRLLKDHAIEIIERVHQARNAVSLLQGTPQGKLVLGVPPSVGTILTVPLVQKIKNEFPNVALQVMEGFSGHLLEWLTAGRIDVAILYNPPSHPSVLVEPLVEDEVFLVGPVNPTQDLPEKIVPLEVFSTLPMILPSSPHGLRRLIEKVLSEHGISPNVEMELEAMTATLLLVEENSGFTVLPYASVHTLVKAGRVRFWRFEEPIKRELLLATATQRPIPSTIRSIIRTVRTEVRDIINTHPWRPES